MARPRKISGPESNGTKYRAMLDRRADSVSLDESKIEIPSGKSQRWHDFFFKTIEALKAIGADSWTDVPAVIEFADVWEEVQELKAKLKGPDGSDNFTDVGSMGQTVVSADYQALMKIRPMYHKLLNDFGMTPRGRAYVYDRRKTSESKASALLRKLDED